MSMFNLSERVAVVTGGSKGIGYSIAMDLAEAGADVAVASRHLDEAEAAAEAVAQRGRKGLAITADVRSREDCERLIQTAKEGLGRIDILINNAGTNIRKPLLEYGEEDWDTILDTNLKGVFFCSQFAAREMMRQQKGRIVNISSAAAVLGAPNLGPYCASKGGVTQLTKVCALEWATHGITVNAIGPTYIKTQRTAAWVSDPERYQLIIDKSPIKRLAETDDLKGLLLLLVSDAASYLTGQTFYIDGGALAGWPKL